MELTAKMADASGAAEARAADGSSQKIRDEWLKPTGSTVVVIERESRSQESDGDAGWQSREIRTNLKQQAKGISWETTPISAAKTLGAKVTIPLLPNMASSKR